MKKDRKIILYIALLILSMVMFTLALITDASGIIGLIVVILSVYLFIGSIIKLCKLNDIFKNGVLNFVDLLFWLP